MAENNGFASSPTAQSVNRATPYICTGDGLEDMLFREETRVRGINSKLNARLVGVELYFDDLQQGKQFYGDTLGLQLLDEEEGRYARFDSLKSFVCLERKGSESYPSRDKAVLFLEVSNLADAIRSIGEEKIVAIEPLGQGPRQPWAALHDPEGYNIVLLEEAPTPSANQRAD
jgi:predicted enzyme related to lactoylglutathione lyase